MNKKSVRRFKVGDKAFQIGERTICTSPRELFFDVEMGVIEAKRKMGKKTQYLIAAKHRFIKNTKRGPQGQAIVTYNWKTMKAWCYANELLAEKEAWAKACKEQRKRLDEDFQEARSLLAKGDEIMKSSIRSLQRVIKIEEWLKQK